MSQVKTYTTAEIRYGTQGGSFVALADHEREVAALREALAQAEITRASWQNGYDVRGQEVQLLVAKNRAQRLLLVEALPQLDSAASAFKAAKPVRNKIRAHLSAPGGLLPLLLRGDGQSGDIQTCGFKPSYHDPAKRNGSDVQTTERPRNVVDIRDALLRETRELVRPMAVLSPGGEFAQLKSRLDKELLHSPAPAPAERMPGCADAAWLLYDNGFYGQHAVLVMEAATILQKATSYAGYSPFVSQEAGDELAAT